MPWTDEELADLRATQESVMPESATVYDVSVVDDDRGGQSTEWTPRARAVPIRLGSPGYRERQNLAERFQAEQVYVGTMPAGTPCDAGDRLVVAGNTYDVLGVNAPESYDTALRVYLRKAG